MKYFYLFKFFIIFHYKERFPHIIISSTIFLLKLFQTFVTRISTVDVDTYVIIFPLYFLDPSVTFTGTQYQNWEGDSRSFVDLLTIHLHFTHLDQGTVRLPESLVECNEGTGQTFYPHNPTSLVNSRNISIVDTKVLRLTRKPLQNLSLVLSPSSFPKPRLSCLDILN